MAYTLLSYSSQNPQAALPLDIVPVEFWEMWSKRAIFPPTLVLYVCCYLIVIPFSPKHATGHSHLTLPHGKAGPTFVKCTDCNNIPKKQLWDETNPSSTFQKTGPLPIWCTGDLYRPSVYCAWMLLVA